jgi:hypothetical protein
MTCDVDRRPGGRNGGSDTDTAEDGQIGNDDPSVHDGDPGEDTEAEENADSESYRHLNYTARWIENEIPTEANVSGLRVTEAKRNITVSYRTNETVYPGGIYPAIGGAAAVVHHLDNGTEPDRQYVPELVNFHLRNSSGTLIVDGYVRPAWATLYRSTNMSLVELSLLFESSRRNRTTIGHAKPEDGPSTREGRLEVTKERLREGLTSPVERVPLGSIEVDDEQLVATYNYTDPGNLSTPCESCLRSLREYRDAVEPYGPTYAPANGLRVEVHIRGELYGTYRVGNRHAFGFSVFPELRAQILSGLVRSDRVVTPKEEIVANTTGS